MKKENNLEDHLVQWILNNYVNLRNPWFKENSMWKPNVQNRWEQRGSRWSGHGVLWTLQVLRETSVAFQNTVEQCSWIQRGEGVYAKTHIDINKTMLFKICWPPRQGNMKCNEERFPLKSLNIKSIVTWRR